MRAWPPPTPNPANITPPQTIRFARLATHDPQTIEDGRTSYPSGHAAEMFAAFTVLSLYLCGKARVFVAAGPVSVSFVLCCVCCVRVCVSGGGGKKLCVRVGRLSTYSEMTDRQPPLNRPSPKKPQGHFAKAALCLLPLGLATFITMSRVAGYKHDFSDINCGEGFG